MALSVVCHRPGDDATAIHRFRYDIYLEELGWDSPEADHERRVLTDPLDEVGVIHSLVDDEGRIQGTLRTVHAEDLDDHALIAKSGALDGIERFGASAVVTTSRFMLAPALRGGTAILRLIREVAAAGLERGVRLNYGDTSPHLLPFYEHMGYRRFQWAFNDPNYGWKFPILMVGRDLERLRTVRSPLLRIVEPHGDDPEAREWFAATYPHSLGERSARLLGADELTATIAALLGSLQRAEVLGALDRDGLHELLGSSTLVTARTGDAIIRQGETGTSMYLLLSGTADVEVDGEQIAVLDAGSWFGEAAFLHDGIRNASVIAGDQSQLLVIDGDHTAKRLERNGALQTAVGGALAKLVAERDLG